MSEYYIKLLLQFSVRQTGSTHIDHLRKQLGPRELFAVDHLQGLAAVPRKADQGAANADGRLNCDCGLDGLFPAAHRRSQSQGPAADPRRTSGTGTCPTQMNLYSLRFFSGRFSGSIQIHSHGRATVVSWGCTLCDQTIFEGKNSEQSKKHTS